MAKDGVKTIMDLVELCTNQMFNIKATWTSVAPEVNKIYIKVLIDDLVKLSRICDAEQAILEEKK